MGWDEDEDEDEGEGEGEDEDEDVDEDEDETNGQRGSRVEEGGEGWCLASTCKWPVQSRTRRIGRR